jgi:hypothetical protein
MAEATNRRGFLSAFAPKKNPVQAPADVLPQTAETALAGEPISRRTVIVGGVTAAFLAGIGSSCKPKDIEPAVNDPAPTNPFNTPNVVAGQAAVYYGELPTNSEDLRNLRSFKEVVVAPPNMPANALDNAVGYGAIAALNQNEVTKSQKSDPAIQANVALQKIGALHAALTAANGYLKDKDGKVVTDPLADNAWMIDLRNPKAYSLMHDYLLDIAKSYKKGIFFDIMDSVIVTENKDRTTYAGLTDKAVQLVQDVSRELEAMPDKKVIVNGGLQDRYDASKTPVVASIAKIPNLESLALEGLYYRGKRDKRDPETEYGWIEKRLGIAAAAKSTTIPSGQQGVLNIFGIEPGADGYQMTSACNASQQYQRWSVNPAIVPPNLHLNASLYVCDGHFNANKSDLRNNAQLAKDGLCR